MWLAEFGENDKVVAVSKALGEMLRVSLNINQTMVPLALELAHTENYLKIQQQRYIDKISYQISGEAKLLTAVVPKLILQPLIENAVYHGVKEKKDFSVIRIRIHRHGGKLLINIMDNGVGIEAEALKQLRQQLQTPESFPSDSVGLLNVSKRIALLYGDSWSMKIYSKKGKGTLLKIEILLDKERETI